MVAVKNIHYDYVAVMESHKWVRLVLEAGITSLSRAIGPILDGAGSSDFLIKSLVTRLFTSIFFISPSDLPCYRSGSAWLWSVCRQIRLFRHVAFFRHQVHTFFENSFHCYGIDFLKYKRHEIIFCFKYTWIIFLLQIFYVVSVRFCGKIQVLKNLKK